MKHIILVIFSLLSFLKVYAEGFSQEGEVSNGDIITKGHACSSLPQGYYRPPNIYEYLNYNDRPSE